MCTISELQLHKATIVFSSLQVTLDESITICIWLVKFSSFHQWKEKLFTCREPHYIGVADIVSIKSQSIDFSSKWNEFARVRSSVRRSSGAQITPEHKSAGDQLYILLCQNQTLSLSAFRLVQTNDAVTDWCSIFLVTFFYKREHNSCVHLISKQRRFFHCFWEWIQPVIQILILAMPIKSQWW